MVATAVALSLGGAVHANPQGLNVAAGQASATALGNLLEIRNSPGAILNWQQFNIGAGETTRFIQDSAASAVFNRVTGGQASQILGTLQSNGQVFLINPNGILFGAGAVVDTAGFLASTLAASDADLLAGRLNFTDSGQAGSIQNLGQLNSHSGGSVVLIAPSIENNGIIHADGEILLAAGHQVTLVDLKYPSVGLSVQAKEGESAVNLGEVIGKNASFFGSLVSNQGYVEATGVEFGEGGTINFVGTEGVDLASTSQVIVSGAAGGEVHVEAEQGDALVSGLIDASGSNGSGGVINVTGQRVALLDGANLNADGAGTGDGGLVQIGGGWQGNNPDLQNSTYTVMQQGASISANAGVDGDGGEVVLWSDDRTDFHGQISATGGSVSGQGGQVETSGKQILQATGDVNVSSVDGGGRYLLDPGDIEIVTTAPSAPILTANPFNAGGAGAPAISYVETATLASALENGSGAVVEVTTAGTGSGNITVVDPLITITPSSPAGSLKLTADGGIFINAPIDLSSLPGTKLELTANGQILVIGDITLNGAEIIANYNVDSGFVFDSLFDNSLGVPPPLFVLNPFVLDPSRQPGPGAVGFQFGPSASSISGFFDLDFNPFADSNGRFGASVTPVNFATAGTGLPYTFGIISTNGVDVDFVLPEDVDFLNPFSVDLLDINSAVSFSNLSASPVQTVDLSILDLFVRSNGSLVLNPYTFTSFVVEGTFRTEVGAQLVLNGNADPNADENLSFGLFDAGATLDVSGLFGGLEPLNANFGNFAPGVTGLTVIATGFDSRIQNDAFFNSVLTIGPSVNIVANSGFNFGPFDSGSALVGPIPDLKDTLIISNYDSNIQSFDDGNYVGTISLRGKATSNNGVVALQANDFVLAASSLTANGPQAAVTLEGNFVDNNLINNSVVRTNGGLLGLTGVWDNTSTGVNPFDQGSIVGFDDLTVVGGSINTGANRFAILDDTLVNFRGVSLSGKIDMYYGSAMVLGYSGQGTGTQTSLNGAQVSMAGYGAILVEGNVSTGVASINGVGEFRSDNQGNVIVGSSAIPPGNISPAPIPQPTTLSFGAGIQVNSLGNGAAIQPDGYALAGLSGGEATFTFGQLPAFAVAIFEYDEFLQDTTTPAQYGAPASFIIDGYPDGSGPIDCTFGCFGVTNNQTVNYAGALGLGNGGRLAGNLNLNNVTFTGSGIIDGNLALAGTSIFSPGNSPGQILVNGNMTLGPNSVSRFEFLSNGQQPGVDYDFLKVTGTLTRNGRLELADISGGLLATPQNFRFIEAGAFSGQFSQLAKLSGGTVLFADPIDGALANGVQTMTVTANAGTQTNTAAGQTLTQTQQPTLPPPLPGSEPPPPPPPGSNDEEEAQQQLAGTTGETPTQQSQSMQIKQSKSGSRRPGAVCK